MNQQNPMIVPVICLIAAVFLATGTSVWTTHNSPARPIRQVASVHFIDNVGYLSRANNPAETSAPYIAANVAIDGIYRERLERINHGDTAGMTLNCSPEYSMNYLSHPPVALECWELSMRRFFSGFVNVTVSGSLLSLRMKGNTVTVFVVFHVGGEAGKDLRRWDRGIFNALPVTQQPGKQPRIPAGSRYSEERQQRDIWQWRKDKWVNTSTCLVSSRIRVDGKPYW